jgi:hypothetical protein
MAAIPRLAELRFLVFHQTERIPVEGDFHKLAFRKKDQLSIRPSSARKHRKVPLQQRAERLIREHVNQQIFSPKKQPLDTQEKNKLDRDAEQKRSKVVYRIKSQEIRLGVFGVPYPAGATVRV